MSLYSSDRPDFIERIAKLAGGTTYRVPTEGRGTRTEQLPDAHAIAAALAFARRSPDDIGPDVAYSMVVRSDAYRHRVVGRLARTLTSGSKGRSSGEVYAALDAAWSLVVWDKAVERPAYIPAAAWGALVELGERVMYASAYDSVAEAERKYRHAA